MDDVRPNEDYGVADRDFPVADEPGMDAPPAIGTDERRMHVRAYNHWVSLLNGRPYPSITDLEPSDIGDFGPHSVLLDFSRDPENPAICFCGAALREEDGLGEGIRTIGEVPGRSLLSRLTDHYLEIIANRAPIGFEAEFVSHRGQATLYRGILMPFSSDGDSIDFVYGVMNWKVVATEAMPADVAEALGEAFAGASQATPTPVLAPVWADGPIAGAIDPGYDVSVDDDHADLDAVAALDEEAGLYDRLAAAREIAEVLRAADGRSRAALYRALGLAYDFALVAEERPAEYAELLADAGIKAQARAPMTPVVKLVFGVDYDKTRLTEFAAALSHGQRLCLPAGMMRGLLESYQGGLKGVVAAERHERRPALKHDHIKAARKVLKAATAQAHLSIAVDGDDEFVLLVARREKDGTVAVLSAVPSDTALLDRALRKLGH